MIKRKLLNRIVGYAGLIATVFVYIFLVIHECTIPTSTSDRVYFSIGLGIPCGIAACVFLELITSDK